MRHLDDIKYESMACLQRAREIDDGALVNGLEFILETLREYQQALRIQDEEHTELNKPFAFPVGGTD